MEAFMVENCKLPLPKVSGEDTIFEYVVGENGEWEHWNNRVSRTNQWRGKQNIVWLKSDCREALVTYSQKPGSV